MLRSFSEPAFPKASAIPPASVDLPCPPDCILELRGREFGIAANVQDHFLPSRDQVDRRRQLFDAVGRDYHRPMIICMHHVIVRDLHAKDIYRLAKIDQMNMGMAWPDPAADHLKVFGPSG